MQPVTMLRLLLAAAFLLAIAAGVLNATSADSLPTGLREPFEALLAAKPGHGRGFVVVAAAYELAVLAAVVGMIMRRRWGRWLGLVVTVLTLAQAWVLGPHVYTGPAFMLSYASKVAWGAGLAMAFWLGDARRPLWR